MRGVGASASADMLPSVAGGVYGIKIAVRDSGVGISATDLAQLFMPYKQARHGIEHTGSSSGLGLYISRGIARQMNGDLVAASDGVGFGSTFIFTFEALPCLEANQGGSPSQLTRRRVSRVWRMTTDASQTTFGPVSSRTSDEKFGGTDDKIREIARDTDAVISSRRRRSLSAGLSSEPSYALSAAAALARSGAATTSSKVAYSSNPAEPAVFKTASALQFTSRI